MSHDSPVVAASVDLVARTRADTVSPISHSPDISQPAKDRWQDLIDHKLIEWGRDPQRFADQGVEPPATEAVQAAFEFARLHRDCSAPPHTAVLDPNGGIVFEWRAGQDARVVHFWDDGSVEFRLFNESKLLAQYQLG